MSDDALVDERWMRVALAEAEAAAALGEVPIGAVLIDPLEQRLLASGYNLRETLHDPSAHAEVVALRAASRPARSWRLGRTWMYVTLEPCAMCAGALLSARVERVIFGTSDPKAGGIVSHFGIGLGGALGHRFSITQGVLEAECQAQLRGFFRALRPPEPRG